MHGVYRVKLSSDTPDAEEAHAVPSVLYALLGSAVKCFEQIDKDQG